MAKKKSATPRKRRTADAAPGPRAEPDTHPTSDAAGQPEVGTQAMSSDAIQYARDFGVDIDQLRASIARTPDERLRELDANVAFLSALRGSARSPKDDR
jgi:hypothetical protein